VVPASPWSELTNPPTRTYQRDTARISIGNLVSVNEPCRSNETRVHWSETGPQGPAGINGTNGTDGKDGNDGTSATFVNYFSGNLHGCSNGGAIYAVGALETYICNGTNSSDATLFRQQDAIGAFDLVTGQGQSSI
jgi:hypothetical protein